MKKVLIIFITFMSFFLFTGCVIEDYESKEINELIGDISNYTKSSFSSGTVTTTFNVDEFKEDDIFQKLLSSDALTLAKGATVDNIRFELTLSSGEGENNISFIVSNDDNASIYIKINDQLYIVKIGVEEVKEFCESFLIPTFADDIYSLTVDDKYNFLLAEPLNSEYKAGERVVIKINETISAIYEGFINGYSIGTGGVAEGGDWVELEFTMPKTNVELTFRPYGQSNTNFKFYVDEYLSSYVITKQLEEEMVFNYLVKKHGISYDNNLKELNDITGHIINYYGKYDNAYAVMLTSNIEAFDNINVSCSINGVTIEYSNGNEILIYNNRNFYTIQEAVVNDIISATDLMYINTYQKYYYPELYGNDNDVIIPLSKIYPVIDGINPDTISKINKISKISTEQGTSYDLFVLEEETKVKEFINYLKSTKAISTKMNVEAKTGLTETQYKLQVNRKCLHTFEFITSNGEKIVFQMTNDFIQYKGESYEVHFPYDYKYFTPETHSEISWSRNSDTTIELMLNYPEYFDLETKEGLQLFMWYEDRARKFALASEAKAIQILSDAKTLRGVSTSEMEKILSCYDLHNVDIDISELKTTNGVTVATEIPDYTMIILENELGLKEKQGYIYYPGEVFAVSIQIKFNYSNEDCHEADCTCKDHFSLVNNSYIKYLGIEKYISNTDSLYTSYLFSNEHGCYINIPIENFTDDDYELFLNLVDSIYVGSRRINFESKYECVYIPYFKYYELEESEEIDFSVLTNNHPLLEEGVYESKEELLLALDESLTKYEEKYGKLLDDSHYKEILDAFGDDFFKYNKLVVTDTVVSGSTSIIHEVKEVYYKDQELYVFVKTSSPFMQDTAMQDISFLVIVSNEYDIEDVNLLH